MKKTYLSPVSEAVKFYPADGVLNNASLTEGFPVDPMDPGFTMEEWLQVPTI